MNETVEKVVDLHTKPFELGEYVLIGWHCLAKVTGVSKDGFDFDCTNGAWSGFYNPTKRQLTINGDRGTHIATILSRAQPPAKIREGGYNKIIPWMLENM